MDKKLIQSLKTNSSFESSQENLMRKSSKGHSNTQLKDYGTVIQLIRSDIMELQSSVQKYSDVLMFYKSSKSFYPSHVQKKLSELEEKHDTAKQLDAIFADSENVEKLMKQYSCNSMADLIPKLALELNYYDLFIKKLNHLAFLITSRLQPDLNDTSTYQDTKSRYHVIENLLELMISKIQKERTEGGESKPKETTSISSTSGLGSSAKNLAKTSLKTKVSHSSNQDILNMTNIDDFFGFDNSDNVIDHIQNLFKKSYNHFTKEFENLAINLSLGEDQYVKENKGYHENLLKIEKFIRLGVGKKNRKEENLNSKIVDLEEHITNMNTLEQVSLSQESDKVQMLFKMIDGCKFIRLMFR